MRVHLALNVRDLEGSIRFYEKLLGAPPSKRKPGYANWALDAPPLKLTLLESPDAPERLNHLGVETFDGDDVAQATRRWREHGIADRVEEGSTCCFARQDKVWSKDPDGVRWESYRVLADAETFGEAPAQLATPVRGEAPAPGAAPEPATPAGGGCGCPATPIG